MGGLSGSVVLSAVLPERKRRFGVFVVTHNLFCFLTCKRFYGLTKPRVGNRMPRMREHRLEAAHQFVFPLRACIERLQAQFDGQFNALVVTGFKMQVVVLLKAAPVTAVESVSPTQKKSPRNHLPIFCRHDHMQVLGHVFPHLFKELLSQIRPLPAFQVSGLIEHVESGKNVVGDIPAMKPGEGNILLGHLPAFFAYGFALARGEFGQKVVEAAIVAIVPVELAANAVQLLFVL